ncbi:MAG TPA: C25 family cysteine peptidase [Gemmataceae bacterium]|jgi:hypothetical protein|nr:C25 family cysteine peptidase [Gemmataceae bacterium]
MFNQLPMISYSLRPQWGILIFLLTLPGLTLRDTPAWADNRPEPGQKPLVIVAPRSFHRALSVFVEHKKKLLPTELVAIEDVLKKHAGVDPPEKLKRFLYDGWKGEHLGYALLVGNAHLVPVRYMVLDRVTREAFDYAFYPSDLYYADLAKADGQFENWNANTEGFHAQYFGEVRGEKNKNDPINFDQIDYLPEIGVGRWPVANPAQAALVAAKTIRYETDLLKGTKAGGRNAAFFVVEGWVDGRGQMDGAARSLEPRFSIEKRYYGGGPPPTGKELLSVLNAGTGVVFHVGHGSNDSWQGCCSIGDLLKATNADRLPIMISAGCSTAYCAPLPPYEGYIDIHGKTHRGTNNGEIFKSPPPPPSPYQPHPKGPISLGEAAITAGPNGAVAYIGCNTGGQPCALTLLEGFAQAMGQEKDRAWATPGWQRCAIITPRKGLRT